MLVTLGRHMVAALRRLAPLPAPTGVCSVTTPDIKEVNIGSRYHGALPSQVAPMSYSPVRGARVCASTRVHDNY